MELAVSGQERRCQSAGVTSCQAILWVAFARGACRVDKAGDVYVICC